MDLEASCRFVIDKLLKRYGVLFRSLLERERQPLPWRDLLQTCRRMELRGELRGGRFVAGYSGEQYALPEAVALMRRLRREESTVELPIAKSDPLYLSAVLKPGIPAPIQKA
jgi:ATP-dependent Lhr-like helicase